MRVAFCVNAPTWLGLLKGCVKICDPRVLERDKVSKTKDEYSKRIQHRLPEAALCAGWGRGMCVLCVIVTFGDGAIRVQNDDTCTSVPRSC